MIEDKIKEAGYVLPPAPKPAASYASAIRSGNLVFTAGQLPLQDGRLKKTGLVARDVSLEEAGDMAIIAVLNALAAVKSVAGSLDKIKKIVRLNGYVASAPDFADQHKVLNYASDLLIKIFGEAGRHTRVAIGVCRLPLDAPVEIDLIVEI